ncbi:E3 ubiquitin-protein ligase RNF19A-like [Diadema antillarum]|uniref:E3 ubiquitin-protein ligase RNF19A-like n=1 Tax=Diadema antillarum TaxID=105358 RepID=UPI003A84BEE4
MRPTMKATEVDTRSVQSGGSQANSIESVSKHRKQGGGLFRFWSGRSKTRKSSTDSDHSGPGTPRAVRHQVGRSRSAAAAYINSSLKKGPGTMECPLCLMERPKEQFPEIITCDHRSCRECLRQYLKIEITESRVNIACPECAEPLHPNDIKLVLQDSVLMNKYEEFTLRRLLMMDPDCRWCPAPDCGFAVLATGCANCPQLFCQRAGCGTSFCYHCKQFWHPNQTCDAARQQRSGIIRKTSLSYSQGSSSQDQIKQCPRCTALIIKLDDGSCNHMTCAVCGAEFCWLCMKEISDLHYLSPSGCTFWGKKPWSRKKKILWQLGTLVGAPVGIALIAGIAVPAIIIGIPVYVGRKVHAKYASMPRHRRNLAIAGSVSLSILVSPVIAALTVGIGVPIMLAYVYGVVPVSLCRSGGCGVTTSNSGGVRIELDEENDVGGGVSDNRSENNPEVNSMAANASIGEASVLNRESTSHLEVAGVITDDTVSDSASTRAIAGASLTGSLSGSGGVGPLILSQHRMDVHAEVVGKRLSISSEATFDTYNASSNRDDKDYQSTSFRKGVPHSSNPLEVHVDIERTSYPNSRHNSGSSNSTEHSIAGPSGSSRSCATSIRQVPGLAENYSDKGCTGDVWELKTSANVPSLAEKGAESSGPTTTTASAMRKSKSKGRSRGGKRSSVKISDCISEAPSYSCADSVSINDSLNSELSAVIADSEPETSSISNVDSASAPPASGGGGTGTSEGKLRNDLSSSTSSTHGLSPSIKDSLSSLTEVENDRPGSGMLVQGESRHSSSGSVNLSLGRVITTDL